MVAAVAKRPKISSTADRPSGSAVGITWLCVSAWLTLSPRPAGAYSEEIHSQLAKRALPHAGLAAPTVAIDLTTATAVRTGIDSYARSNAALKDAWIKRYPNPGDFDAWAEKEFLLLAAGAKVYGIDRTDERIGPSATLLDLIATASREPDDDWRNRERLAYDKDRTPLKDKHGQPVPADPAILNMGKLGALSSQAHAHYGLAQVEFSDDPEVLKREPKRFAKKIGYPKGPLLTIAAEMAQEDLDMALLAALNDGQSHTELSWLYAGQGFHYLEDVGNQIHTVQVGLYDFFFDAFLERLKLGLLTGGGYLGKMRSLGSIGIDILTNHHVLSEQLTAKRFLAQSTQGAQPEVAQLIAAPGEEDPAFAAKLDAALQTLGGYPERGEFAAAITRALIEVSSDEGDDVYRVTRKIAQARLRKEGVVYEELGTDPDTALRPRTPDLEPAYQEFWSLQQRAFRRVGMALRRWVSLQQKVLAAAQTNDERAALRDAVTERLVKRQLRMLDEADARRADYLRDPPHEVSAPEHAPELLAADIVIGVGSLLIVALVIRRMRRKAKG